MRNILFASLLLLSLQPASAQRKYNKPAESAPLNIIMVKVHGGMFDMGSDDEAADRKPAHNVTLKSYYIGAYEVTQEQWKLVMGNNPSTFVCDECPVTNISYADIQAYISKLNEMTGKHYRMPTEAEWEYAARGGDKEVLVKNRQHIAKGGVDEFMVSNPGTRVPEKTIEGKRYSGKKLPQDVAWYERNSYDHVHPIGRKKPNEIGVYDMCGNAEEWCNDWYLGNYGGRQPVENPQGPASGSAHVVRGGAYNNTASEITVTRRAAYLPGTKASSLGFRLAMDL